MDQTVSFGSRLRQLRRAKRLSQEDLALAVGVDFTYISKLENDRLPPPSAKTILAIAQAVEGDPDELAALAGKIPADIAEIVAQNPIALKVFRSVAARVRSPEDWAKYLERDRAEEPPLPPRE